MSMDPEYYIWGREIECIQVEPQSNPFTCTPIGFSFSQLGIDHFTVLCSVTRPLNKSEAGVDLVMIQTSLLFVS